MPAYVLALGRAATQHREGQGMEYKRQMLKAINETPKGTPLLLHACCAPCAGAALAQLGGHFAVSLLYYNPNIQPQQEYEKRLTALKSLVKQYPIKALPLISYAFNDTAFVKAGAGLESQPEGGARCRACFALRLGETARRAKAMGIAWFASTLTVGPQKSAALINSIGMHCAAQQGLVFLQANFKKGGGYQQSIQLCRQYGLYRQGYCGCLYGRASASAHSLQS